MEHLALAVNIMRNPRACSRGVAPRKSNRDAAHAQRGAPWTASQPKSPSGCPSGHPRGPATRTGQCAHLRKLRDHGRHHGGLSGPHPPVPCADAVGSYTLVGRTFPLRMGFMGLGSRAAPSEAFGSFLSRSGGCKPSASKTSPLTGLSPGEGCREDGGWLKPDQDRAR